MTIWAYLGHLDQVRSTRSSPINADQPDQVWAYLVLSGAFWSHIGISGQEWTYLDQHRLVWINLDQAPVTPSYFQITPENTLFCEIISVWFQ